MLNSYDLIKEAFQKMGHDFAGRPQDMFWVEEIQEGMGRFKTQMLTRNRCLNFAKFMGEIGPTTLRSLKTYQSKHDPPPVLKIRSQNSS